MQDQRTSLKVKIKSLAEEARIIRREERKATDPEKRQSLAEHRRGTVRREARHSLLAYGFLRGMKYHRMEAKTHTEPDWAAVRRMVLKYGLEDYGWHFWKRGEKELAEKELLDRYAAWRRGE